MFAKSDPLNHFSENENHYENADNDFVVNFQHRGEKDAGEVRKLDEEKYVNEPFNKLVLVVEEVLEDLVQVNFWVLFSCFTDLVEKLS